MPQSRLQQLIDHLFATSATALVLESNTTGQWLQKGDARLPAFRQPLRTGQILLLLSEVVPKEQSTQLLSGAPTRFVIDQPQGQVAIHVTLSGDDVRVEIIPVPPPKPTQADIETQPMRSAAPGETTVGLLSLLSLMGPRGATHLHLSPGAQPFARVEGQLRPWPDAAPWSSGALRGAVVALAPEERRAEARDSARVELTYVTDASAFHVYGSEGRDGFSVVVRCVPRVVPTPGALGLPSELMAMPTKGLWLFAGAAGQGTTTTLASVVQATLASKPCSVLMVDGPCEYVLGPGKGVLHQVPCTSSRAELAAAMRQFDADLIAFASVDDAASLEAAVALAGQGRLVIGAMHAPTAAAAIEKAFGLCAPGSVSQLVAVLHGVFAQQLVRRLDGGRAVAWESLPVHDAMRPALRPSTVASLPAARTHGFDDSLADLVRAGAVDLNEGLRLAEDPQQLRARLSLQSVA